MHTPQQSKNDVLKDGHRSHAAKGAALMCAGLQENEPGYERRFEQRVWPCFLV